MLRKTTLFLSCLWFVLPLGKAQNPLEKILSEQMGDFSAILDSAEHYHLQIIYTQIDRDQKQFPHFQSYHFHTNDSIYYYPASTVKMPVAFLALEKINQLQILGLDKESYMQHGAARAPQTEMRKDSTAQNGKPSMAHYLKKIFLVSDNDAYNRLYEWLGQVDIERRLAAKGYQHCRIIHRLGAEGASFGPQDNRFTNPVSFYDNQHLLHHQGEVYGRVALNLPLQAQQQGIGFYRRGKFVESPFDFQDKNYCSLQDLHDMLKAVYFPEAVPATQRFGLRYADYQFLYRWMSAYPRQSAFPAYNLPDGYVKFFLYGGAEDSIPPNIKIFNKVGIAYGYLTDIAYIVDTKNQLEFILAATLRVNKNQIFNDNEYDELGFPFFRQLGKAIYEYERNRPRTHPPDLSKYEKP